MGELTVAQAKRLLIHPGEVERGLLREALLVAVRPADYRMFGLCADTAEEAVAALHGYLNAFGEPLPAVEVARGLGPGVFIKYNGKTASCSLSAYTGSERGAIVSCYSPGREADNETYAELPLDLFGGPRSQPQADEQSNG